MASAPTPSSSFLLLSSPLHQPAHFHASLALSRYWIGPWCPSVSRYERGHVGQSRQASKATTALVLRIARARPRLYVWPKAVACPYPVAMQFRSPLLVEPFSGIGQGMAIPTSRLPDHRTPDGSPTSFLKAFFRQAEGLTTHRPEHSCHSTHSKRVCRPSTRAAKPHVRPGREHQRGERALIVAASPS